MPYEVKDLLDGIKQGIADFANHEIRREYRSKVPHPEYLTTSSIAFKLADIGRSQQNHFTVQCEENTRHVWNSSLLSWSFQTSRSARKNPSSKFRFKNRQRNSKERPGNIDITLFDKYDRAFAIIETKGELSFTEEGELYAGSRVEVTKDLIRNAEYILKTGHRQGVQYSAFTFYVEDKSSVVEADARDFMQKMQKYFNGLVGKLKHSSIKAHVHIGTFDRDLYPTHADAMEKDERGAPAQDMQPAWHIAYGVISLYLVGNNISDATLIDI